MTDSLFNNAADPNGDDTPLDPNKNFFEELVGEGKKFKTPEELARGKAEADAFIARLTREQAELRTELNTRLKMEEYLDKMGTKLTGNNQSPNSRSDGTPNEPNGERPDPDKTKALSMEDVERLFEEREQRRIQSENLKSVQAALAEKFGPEYFPILRTLGEELGMSGQELDDMARSRPKALLKLVDASGRSQATPTNPSLFTPPVGARQGFGKVSGDKTKSYYDNLKAKDASTYWSPRVQNEMHQNAQRLGEKFFD